VWRMSRWPERYLRWFGTRLPVTSRLFLYGFMAAIAVVLSFPLHAIVGPLSVIVFTPVVVGLGVLFHFLFLYLQKIRLEAPSGDNALLEIVSRVIQKVVVSSELEIWERESEDLFIVSTYNALFEAIIISTSMKDSIVANPDSGEPLLAFHLLRMPRGPWLVDLVGSTFVFWLVAALLDYVVIPPISGWSITILVYFFTMFAILGSSSSIGIILVLFVKGAFWRHENSFEIVNEMYGVHPQVAKLQVERSRALDSDETRAVLWGVLEWEKRKRGGRRVGVAILCGALVFSLPFLFLWLVQFSYSLYSYAMTVNVIPSALAGFVAYLAVRQWDKRAMKEVEYATAGAREPIWMD
jgi:hypothetical protein